MDERRARALDERMIRGGRRRGRRRHRRDSCVSSVVARRGVVAVRAGGKPRAPRVGLVRVAYAFAQAQAAESPARELQRPLEERGEAAGVEEIAHLHGRHRAALERERDVGDVEKPDRADGDAHAAAARDANLPSGGGRREGGGEEGVGEERGGRPGGGDVSGFELGTRRGRYLGPDDRRARSATIRDAPRRTGARAGAAASTATRGAGTPPPRTRRATRRPPSRPPAIPRAPKSLVEKENLGRREQNASRVASSILVRERRCDRERLMRSGTLSFVSPNVVGRRVVFRRNL